MNDQVEKSESICIYPFSHLATKTDGDFKVCCRSEPIGNIRHNSLNEIWNGETLKRIRKQMLNNERPPECKTCWAMEDVGARSMRQRARLNGGENSRWNTFSGQFNYVDQNGQMALPPKSIELKISNLCNLKCRMCHPLDSTLWAKDWPAVSDMMKIHNPGTQRAAEFHNITNKPLLNEFQDNDLWWTEFESLIDSLEIVEFAGGEPLIDPVHFKLLEMLQKNAPNIHLKYSTNLTKLKYRGEDVTSMWKNFKLVEIYASVDGINNVYDYIRTGGTYQHVSDNLDRVQGANHFNLSELAVACTVQIYNAFQIIEMANHFLNRNIKFHTHHVTSPDFLNIQVLPLAVKKVLTEQALEWLENTPDFQCEIRILEGAKKHIHDFVNFMNGKDHSHLLPAFTEYTRRLDSIRGTDASSISPHLKEIMDSFSEKSILEASQ